MSDVIGAFLRAETRGISAPVMPLPLSRLAAASRRQAPWSCTFGGFTMATNDLNSAGCKHHDGRTSDSGCARPGHRLRRGSPVG
jgi:hypothetical protein